MTNSKGSTEQTTKITVKEPTPVPQASEELTFINPLKDLSVVDGKSTLARRNNRLLLLGTENVEWTVKTSADVKSVKWFHRGLPKEAGEQCDLVQLEGEDFGFRKGWFLGLI